MLTVDVAIIGAGFGGSLLSLILRRLGLRCLLIDRTSHPRFAIGESATPIGDLIWAGLCQRYDLPRLAPLAEYGSWQREYPDLPCGLKRGFSYFLHQPGRSFEPSCGHESEMLVAASHSADDADTHWYRATFDEFICREAQREGVDYSDQTQLTELHATHCWELTGVRHGQPFECQARFLIDASGEGGFLARQLGLVNQVEQMQTCSRPLFAHFRDVPPWVDIQGFTAAMGTSHPFSEHPYPCDDAVVHHQFTGGWMWVIPFNNGITSAGFALDERHFPLDPKLSAAAEWQSLLQTYPSIGRQFADARIVGPGVELIRGQRMQRWLTPAAGPNWALLPTAATFLDPLHSTGNAHTLSGIERLAAIFERFPNAWDQPAFHAALQGYHSTLQLETQMLDRVIHGCYRTLGDMNLFDAFSATYFVSAIWAETRRRSGEWQPHEAFLNAHDPQWCAVVEALYRDLDACAGIGTGELSVADFITRARQRFAPFNLAELCHPGRRHLYPYP